MWLDKHVMNIDPARMYDKNENVICETGDWSHKYLKGKIGTVVYATLQEIDQSLSGQYYSYSIMTLRACFM